MRGRRWFTTRAAAMSLGVLLAAGSAVPVAAAQDARGAQIVVDNDSPGFTRSGFESVSAAGEADHYGADYRHSGAEHTGTQWARWTPTIPETGTYNVFIRWNSSPDLNRPTDVPVTVVSDGGDATWETTIDQRQNSLNWYLLGSFTLSEGTADYVELREGTGRFTTADAIKVVPAEPAAEAYADGFEDEAIDRSPSHWIEHHEFDDWKVARDGNDAVYRHATEDTRSPVTWLHAFEQDVDVSARLKVAGLSDAARVGIPVRYNTAESQVFAGYVAASGTWQIAERRGADTEWEVLAESDPAELGVDIWRDVRVRAQGGSVTLSLDGAEEPLLETDRAGHRTPGRVALEATAVDAMFDDVSVTFLSGQGRVEEGVLDYTLGDGDGVYREGASVVELESGEIVIRHADELFRSQDDGETFSPDADHEWPENPFTHHSFLRLKSGALLTMISETESGTAGDDPPNRFRAMTSVDEGGTWSSGGTTWEEFREWPENPGNAESIVMNDKLSQSSDGRIFYTVTFRRTIGTKVGHDMEIYYSDDDGDNWTKADQDSTDWAGEHDEFGEGKVIEATDGTLRLLTPYNDEDGIMQSISRDGGDTWEGASVTPGLMQARSSFGVARSEEPADGAYFMVWVLNDRLDHATGFLPRSRLALATSTDGVNWQYVMDLDRWVGPRAENGQPVVQFVDPGITVTEDYVYVTSGRSEYAEDGNHFGQRLRVYRVDRDSMSPYPEWPAEY